MKRKHKVLWTEVAVKDLSNIIDYIAEDNPKDALKILKTIRKKLEKLHYLPTRGRVVPELRDQGMKEYRELVIPPWRVMFRIDGWKVYVSAVLDARRNIEDILLRRLIDQRL